MRRLAFLCWVWPLICLALTGQPLCAQEATAEPKQPDVLAGHSYHGEAFNEGARQRAYLMGGTGEVTFPATTRSPLAQRFINQGVGQLHGFWYFEAERSFRQAAMIDPGCAIAYWGMAFANKNNAKRAQGFIKAALQRQGNATERERQYIDALKAYVQASGAARGNRGRRLAEAFGAIADQYPQDIEARAFQGLFLYLTRSSKPALTHEQVDAVLRKVLAVQPMHPCHHYVIHLWDYKDPARVLPSAAVCGQTSPAIAHMWHMPGHIYSRLKRYGDAVWQQEASARVDHAHMIRDHVMPDQIHNFAHNNEWLTRNLIHVGRAHDALALAKNMIELPRHPKYNTLARRGSTYYGRLRLFQVLNDFELWDELITLAQSPYLEPSDLPGEQIKRLRHLGRAFFAKGDSTHGREVLKKLQTRLQRKKSRQKEHQAARNSSAGDKKAPAAGKKPSRPPRGGSTLRSLQQAVDELTGRQAIAGGDFHTGLALLRKSGGIGRLDMARVQLHSGDLGGAVKSAREEVNAHQNEVLPLAHLVEILWKAGKKDEAEKHFRQLRTLAGAADLDVPALKRLASIAAALRWPADWRTPASRPKDFGTRPPLEQLGPFRWHPFPAGDWTLKDVDGRIHHLRDYRGKPVIVIFYLGYGCLHCVEQLQAFAPKTEAFRKAGIELIAISTDNPQQLKKSQRTYGKGKFPFPLLSDAPLRVFQSYRCYDDFEKFALHGTFLIDGEGRVRWQDISYEPFMDPDFLLNEAQRLLKQSPASASTHEKPPTAGAKQRSETGGVSGR